MRLPFRPAAVLLLLTTSLAAGGAVEPAAPVPLAELPGPAAVPAPEATVRPPVPSAPQPLDTALAGVPLQPWADVSTFLGDTALIVAWPLRLDVSAASAVGAGTAGSLLLFRHDVHLYRAVHTHVRWTFRGASVFQLTLLLGDGLVDAGVVSLFALAGPRGKRVAVRGLQALLSVAATSVVAKAIFRVPRPQFDPENRTFFAGLRDDAFPSGHTMSAFAIATVISGEFPWAAPVAFGAASLVGVSVIKRGWHWPSDVLAGAVLGVVIGRTGLLIDRERGITIGPMPSGRGLAISGEI